MKMVAWNLPKPIKQTNKIKQVFILLGKDQDGCARKCIDERTTALMVSGSLYDLKPWPTPFYTIFGEIFHSLHVQTDSIVPRFIISLWWMKHKIGAFHRKKKTSLDK